MSVAQSHDAQAAQTRNDARTGVTTPPCGTDGHRASRRLRQISDPDTSQMQKARSGDKPDCNTVGTEGLGKFRPMRVAVEDRKEPDDHWHDQQEGERKDPDGRRAKDSTPHADSCYGGHMIPPEGRVPEAGREPSIDPFPGMGRGLCGDEGERDPKHQVRSMALFIKSLDEFGARIIRPGRLIAMQPLRGAV